MAEYKKKKGIKVSAARNTGRPKQRNDSGRNDVTPLKTGNASSTDRENRMQREPLRNSGAKGQNYSSGPVKEGFPVNVEKDLLDQTGRIPVKSKKNYRTGKEIRKSKPPAKRYQARRPVTYDSGDDSARFSVIDGRKLIKRRQKIITASLVGLLILLLVAAAFSTPVGITEYLQDSFTKVGSGNGYPVLISGDDTVFVTSEYGLTTVIGASTFECYNKTGKQVFTRQHGYNNPALAQSQSRMVVYDRGSTGYLVGNLTKTLYSGNFDKKIYTAAIGRNGTMAFATASVEYNSELAVYDKTMRNIFNWYSANATLTAAGISDNGKKIAAATSSVSGGAYTSTIYIFDIKSSNPTATVTINGSIAVSIERINSNTFLILCNDQAVIMDWSGNQKYTHKAEGTLCLAKAKDGSVLFVDKLSGNSGEYGVSVIDHKLSPKADFTVNMTLKDATVSDNFLYFLTDNKIMAYDFSGNALFGTDCDFSVSGLTTLGDGNVLEIGLGEIKQIKGVKSNKPIS